MDDLLLRFFGQPGALAVVATTVLLLMAEVGYRLGRRLFTAADSARRSQIGGVQAAVLGLLALLLGFTFSMAADRYDHRRELVLRQANTIGTTWLRSGLLPDAHREPVRDLLRAYLDLQVPSHDALRDPAVIAAAQRRAVEIRSTLWRHAEASAQEAPNDITATFIETLNDLIDTEAARITASTSRIPPGVWLILVVVAAVGCWTSGYGAGAEGARSPLTSVLLPLLATVVMLLIFDLNNERRGIISVSQQPLVDLQNSIRSASGHGHPGSGR
jgi:hypothetical protein